MSLKRERRYVVCKISDIESALSNRDVERLCALTSKIIQWRLENGKNALECVVVESDWPEYEPTWQAIEKRMDGQ